MLRSFVGICDSQLDSIEGYEPGQQLAWEELFKVGDKVDVAGTSNGKGFQGELACQRGPCQSIYPSLD